MDKYYLTHIGKEKLKGIIDVDDCEFVHVDYTELYLDGLSGIAFSDEYIRNHSDMFINERIKTVNDFISNVVKENKSIEWIHTCTNKDIENIITHRPF